MEKPNIINELIVQGKGFISKSEAIELTNYISFLENKTNQNLRINLKKDISDISNRINQLMNNTIEYAEADNYSDASKCKIKFETLGLVKKRLNETLSKSE